MDFENKEIDRLQEEAKKREEEKLAREVEEPSCS